MEHKGILSSAFNMSLGFVPVIISILLCELITQDTAIYIGTVIGIVGVYLSYHRKGILLPNFILYISAGILILLSLAALIPGDYVPEGALPLTLEVSILIPMLILYMHKKRFINHFLKQIGSCNKRLYAQGAEAAVVSARIALIFGILHFIIISIVIICQNPLSSTSKLTPFKCSYSSSKQLLKNPLPKFSSICLKLHNLLFLKRGVQRIASSFISAINR